MSSDRIVWGPLETAFLLVNFRDYTDSQLAALLRRTGFEVTAWQVNRKRINMKLYRARRTKPGG